MTVLGVYLLFLLVGMYSGQDTFSVEIYGPLDGAQLGCPPVKLAARVTIRSNPVSDVTTRFTIHHSVTGETSFDILTDTNGMAEFVLPASSGNYTWQVSARKLGYPTIATRSPSFSVRLMLVVDGLTPSPFVLAVSPVTFKARASDMNNRPVDSANVTFYVDSAAAGSSVTNPKGIAQSSSPIAPGGHAWFASACKNGQGGISETISFLVGQAAALPTDKPEGEAMKEPSQLGRSYSYTLTGSAIGYPSAIMMTSCSALREKLRIERTT